jgi:hypothetical protein
MGGELLKINLHTFGCFHQHWWVFIHCFVLHKFPFLWLLGVFIQIVYNQEDILQGKEKEGVRKQEALADSS